jgi:hypothetical protein
MAICEKCGTEFTPVQKGEVSSLRILCSPCEDRHKAERAARARAAASSSGAAAAPRASAQAAARPTAQPGVAARPATARPAAAAKPAAAPPPRTQPSSSMSAASRPVARPPAPAARPTNNSAHATSGASRAPARPAPAPERPFRPERRSERAQKQHAEGHIVAEAEKKTMTIMWIVVGVLLLGAAVFIFQVKSKVNSVKQAEEAQITRVAQFRKDMEALKNSEKESDAVLLIERAENKAEFGAWKNTANEGDILAWVAKSKNLIENNHLRADAQRQMADIEAKLARVNTLTSDDLMTLRRSIADIDGKQGLLDTAAIAQVSKSRVAVDRAYSSALHDEAKATAASNPSKGALVKFAKAEEEILRLFEAAITGKNKDEEGYYKLKYQEIITESDALATAVFAPDVVEKTPAVDLLTGEPAQNWAAAEMTGFSHRLEGGVLHLIGPDPTAKGSAVISNLDREREQVRDFVIDMQFTLESGETDLYLRVGKAFNAQKVEIYPISTKNDNAFVAGKTYEMKVTLIGSKLTVETEPSDVSHYENEIKWTKSRKGGVGFVIPDGTSLKITRFKVKTLR